VGNSDGVEGCVATGTTLRAAISTAVMTDDSGLFSGLILPACFVAILFDVVPLSIELDEALCNHLHT
jgi:hypothetical protein